MLEGLRCDYFFTNDFAQKIKIDQNHCCFHFLTLPGSDNPPLENLILHVLDGKKSTFCVFWSKKKETLIAKTGI